MPKTFSPRQARTFRETARNPIYIIVDDVRSMHNVGSFFRTGDAALVKKIYLTGISPCPPRLAISKTALGCEEAVPWEHRPQIIPLIKELQKQGVQVVALELDPRATSYTKIKYRLPAALVIGHELQGLSKEILKQSDTVAAIKMRGFAHSLNVSVALGVALFEVLRQNKL